MSLGRISLGRHGGEISASGGTSPLFRQILAKMEAEQPELKESLVAWYSPNLQGLTNAELYSTDKEYNNGLRDLSGNNNHMTLYGMGGVEGEGHVDGDGHLVFDGVDDYAKCDTNLELAEFTIVCERKLFDSLVASALDVGITSTSNDVNEIFFELYGNNAAWTSRVNGFNSQRYITDYILPDDIAILTSLRYENGEGDGIGFSPLSIVRKCIAITINTIRNSYKAQGNIELLRHLAIFSKNITTEEKAWIKTNMLVNQEVAKHKVTLWHEGTKLATLNIQNGNTIDTDELHYEFFGNQCSCNWYTDVDCSELYYGQAVTEDMNLYCDSQMLYEYMLEQLDEVGSILKLQ